MELKWSEFMGQTDSLKSLRQLALFEIIHVPKNIIHTVFQKTLWITFIDIKSLYTEILQMFYVNGFNYYI